MLATLGGFLALLMGLLLLLLPLLVTELSRPRDSAWGAVVLLLGLVLVTSADRLTGAPMLAVLCGGLLIGRLGSEVAQARWRALSDEERLLLRSSERWSRSLHQLGAVAASLLQGSAAGLAAVAAWIAERRQARPRGKRWVRSEGSPTTDADRVVPPDQADGEDGASVRTAGEASGHIPPEATGPDGEGTLAAALPSAAGEALAPAQPAADADPMADSTPEPMPDPMAAASAVAPEPLSRAHPSGEPSDPGEGVRLVQSFAEIDPLLDQARQDQADRDA